jgi:hypothetical protein
MVGAGFALKRPVGRALIVGSPSARSQPLAGMQALQYECAELDDPYAAAAELLRRPLVYRALVLSLTSLFREELPLIATIKRRLPHVDIWLTHIVGRQAALAEAMRYGADGLLGEDGALHRMNVGPATADVAAAKPAVIAPPESEIVPAADPEAEPAPSPDPLPGEPVLSADELRALLAEEPAFEPDGEP